MTLSSADNVFPAASEDPNGQIAVAWLDRQGDPSHPAIHVRTSPDGIHWGSDQVVAVVPGGDLGQLSVSVTADGGGFVSFRDSAGSAGIFHGKIDVAQFGPVTPTGHPGLGLQPGGAGPPAGDQSAYATCTDVHFGAIDALAESGCFLRDPSNPTSGAAVTDGEIKLNGLEIIPDAGVKIAIDPRLHTINTTGSGLGQPARAGAGGHHAVARRAARRPGRRARRRRPERCSTSTRASSPQRSRASRSMPRSTSS